MNRPLHPFSLFAEQIDPSDDPAPEVRGARDRSIGDLIREARGLTLEQIELIVGLQRRKGIRFGEAAVLLGLASSDDILKALSHQYDYAYTPEPVETNSELIVATSPFSDDAEAFRELRSQLLMGVLNKQHAPRALAILSPNVGDGKSYLAANLAVSMSQLGERTLLIDADMRTPRQHCLFGLESHLCGLSHVLSARTSGNAVHRVEGLPHLFVMPVGVVPPNPLELLQHPTLGLLLMELLSKFDHVIVDTPAAVYGADARLVAGSTRAALVVCRKGRSQVKAMQDLLKRVEKTSAAVAGVVMNSY